MDNNHNYFNIETNLVVLHICNKGYYWGWEIYETKLAQIIYLMIKSVSNLMFYVTQQ